VPAIALHRESFGQRVESPSVQPDAWVTPQTGDLGNTQRRYKRLRFRRDLSVISPSLRMSFTV